MNKSKEQTIKELTMMLLYLAKFQDQDISSLDPLTDPKLEYPEKIIW